MNVKRMRADFPAYHLKPDWAYLDTAATSQTPQCVTDAMTEYMCAYRASVHRGVYKEAVRATEAYEQAREHVARFIGAEADEVVFTSGATASSNTLVYALEHSIDWKLGDVIVTSVMEHHSSLVPLQQLAMRKQLIMRYVPLGKGAGLDLKQAEALIDARTKLVSVMLASNVTGALHDIARMSAHAHKVGAVMVSDLTAAAGHVPIAVRKLGIDAGYFSGHKMCGPTGIGVLYGTHALLQRLQPGFYGGGMISDVTLAGATWTTPPHMFESGTPNVAGAIGLAAAVDYLTAHSMQDIRMYIEALVTIARDALKQIPGVQAYAAPPTKNVGIISFTVEGVHPHDVAEIAARHHVAVRAGHHCAMPLHAALGVPATVRASFYIYNTKRDIDALVSSVKKAQRLFKALPATSDDHA